MELIEELADGRAALGVAELAHPICQLVDVEAPAGGLKNHECRQLLERLRDWRGLACQSCAHWGRRGA